MGYTIELRGITKRFPDVIANDNISLHLKGVMHAIVGENGARKTTLMNIIFGLYKPNEAGYWFTGNLQV